MIKNWFKKEEIENKKGYLNSYIDGDKFKNALEWANEIVENEDKENTLVLLDYIMEMVRNDLKYSLLTEIIYSKRFDVLDITRKMFIPQIYTNQNGVNISVISKEVKEINLIKDTIISVPYRRERKQSAIVYLRNNKFKYMEDNHMGNYYELVDVTYIYNGIHSISGGVELKKDGSIIVKDVVKVSELFEHIHTDGINWIKSHNNEIVDCVADYRIAILYEVARLKNNIH